MENQVIKSDESVALEFVGRVRGYLSDVSKSFFKIGYELSKAQDGKHFKALGYESLEELSEDVFGFSKTTTYDMIKVYKACRMYGLPSEMYECCEPYSFSQLAAMERGGFASPETLIAHGLVKPTDSVRSIKKYVSYFNKYTERYSSYPKETLQEWLELEEQRKELESAEQLQLGELVEEAASEDESERSEKEWREMVTDFEPQDSYEDEEYEEEIEETEENVSCETEEEELYSFENRASVRAFMADYENWPSTSGLYWLFTRSYGLRNGARVYAVWSSSYEDVESGSMARVVRYYLSTNGIPAEVTKDQLEKYIAAHVDEL